MTQVPCTPPDNIIVDVNQANYDAGGYLALTLQQVAGPGNINAITLTDSVQA